jgi:hypothetical protein
MEETTKDMKQVEHATLRKPEKKRPLERPALMGGLGYIKIDQKETSCKDIDWVQLAQERTL